MIELSEDLCPPRGLEIEIGSTGGFLKDLKPRLLTTDVRVAPGIDLLLDAQKIPLRDGSVSTIYSKDCLHHIPDVRLFFREALRILEPGGVIVCFEPYWGTLARLVYQYIHPERFDSKTTSWTFESSRPMDSNQALLSLLLRRDRSVFQREFPQLEIVEWGPLVGPSYILSGGVDHRNLLPTRLLLQLSSLENRTWFWRRHLALGFLVAFRNSSKS